MLEATQLHPPRFGPQYPVHPQLLEMVRPFAGDVGGNVYPAYLGQTVVGVIPVMRDRIPVYLWEPNGDVLVERWYEARLVSNFRGLPLYAVGCCGTGAGLSQGSSSSSLSGPAKLIINPPTGPTIVTQNQTVTYTGTFTVVPPDSPFVGTLTTNMPSLPGPVTLTIGGGPTNPFTYTVTTKIPITTTVGLYILTFTIVTATGQIGIVKLTITVIAGNFGSSSSSSLNPCVTGCGDCACEPLRFTFSTASIIDGFTCVVCEGYNGSWTLYHNPAPTYTLNPAASAGCVWDSGDSDVCGGGYPSWILYTDGLNRRLIMGGGNDEVPDGGFAGAVTPGGLVWHISEASWDCLLDNTLFIIAGLWPLCFGGDLGITVSRV